MLKTYSKVVLVFMGILMLTSCVVTVNNNIGSDIHTTKNIDDIGVEQDYDTKLDITKDKK